MKESFNYSHEVFRKFNFKVGDKVVVERVRGPVYENLRNGDAFCSTLEYDVMPGEIVGLVDSLRTSRVKDIFESGGNAYFSTENGSTYKIKRIDEEEKFQKKLIDREGISDEFKQLIKENFEKQPQSTKKLLSSSEFDDIFCKTVNFDDKTWVFSKNFQGDIMALVNSGKNSIIFKPRFFRKSGSDHQFKSLPGTRDDFF